MRITRLIAAALALSAFLTSRSIQAEEPARWPQSPDELAVSLTVDQALEEGPLVCTVTLKNVSKARLKYATSMFEKGAYCRVDADWKPRKQSPELFEVIDGDIGPYQRNLYPGQTASEIFYLHQSFLNIPSGKVGVRFGWCVYRIVEKPAADKWESRSLDVLFDLKGSQVVEVAPATEQNVASVLRELEDDFAKAAKRVEHGRDCYWSSGDPSEAFVLTIKGCRHKEFVPLLFEALDRLPAADFRRELVGTVYESFSTPEEGFSALADYLASPRPAAAAEAFDYWELEDRGHKYSRRRQEELKKPPPTALEPDKARLQELMREVMEADEEAWKDSKRHLDTRPTPAQFARLRAVENVWVRALLYAHYPGQCPTEWVQTLLGDMKQAVQAPARFHELIARLDDDDFEVREQATAELVKDGPTFAWHLWAAPQDRLSPEAVSRLQQVRARVEKPELPPLWRRTISYLAWNPTPQSQELLDALMSGDHPSLIGQTAQAAREEAKKQLETHPR